MMVTREEVLRAGDLIRQGKLVAFPTETVYGLGANALDAEAVGRIFAAKGRPATSPLIVHVGSIEMARSVVTRWPETARHLTDRFWPGPLTLVLPKAPHVPDQVTAGLPSVGIRMPDHWLARDLIDAAGVPIAAPSANRFTELSPTTAEHVRRGLGTAVDMILDDGPTDIGIESTVLSLVVEGEPALLRPGMVTRAEIESVIGPVVLVSSAEGAHPSPGLHVRHYSPRTPVLVTSSLPRGKGAYIWRVVPQTATVSVRMPSTVYEYARRLYGVLHELDGQNLEFIAIEPLPKGVEWDGIRDRLQRAASR